MCNQIGPCYCDWMFVLNFVLWKCQCNLKYAVFLYVKILMHTKETTMSYSTHQWLSWLFHQGNTDSDSQCSLIPIPPHLPFQSAVSNPIVLFIPDFWPSELCVLACFSNDWKHFPTWNSCQSFSEVLSTIWHNKFHVKQCIKGIIFAFSSFWHN